MARAHIPKFGEWDNAGANVNHTVQFEMARKVKSGITDPQENPDGLVHVRRGLGSNSDRHPLPSPPYRYPLPPPAPDRRPLPPPPNHHPLPPPPNHHPLPPPPAVKSTISADKNHTDGHSRQNAPSRHKSIDHPKGTRSNRVVASESGSEKSSTSDHSQSNLRRSNSGKKKISWAGRSSFSSSGSGSSRFGGSKKHKKTASIPKFGDWDDKDPKSGEGFTEIFERAKAEKRDASSNFPTIPTPQSNDSDSRKIESHWSKMFCCMFPRGADQ